MKHIPDDTSLEQLLRGTINQPSVQFEEALAAIPGEERKRYRLKRLLVAAPLAAAAAFVLSTIIFLGPMEKPANEPLTHAPADSLDSEWVELLSLADAVAVGNSLADEELRTVIEFYAFNQ